MAYVRSYGVMAGGSIEIRLLVLNEVPDPDFDEVLVGANQGAAEYAEGASFVNASVHYRTGRMERGIDTEVNGPEGYELFNDVRHSLFVHEGTGLFGPKRKRITPRRKKALHFFIDGEEIFARSVRGQKGDDFMERAWENSVDLLEHLTIEGVEREWERG